MVGWLLRQLHRHWFFWLVALLGVAGLFYVSSVALAREGTRPLVGRDTGSELSAAGRYGPWLPSQPPPTSAPSPLPPSTLAPAPQVVYDLDTPPPGPIAQPTPTHTTRPYVPPPPPTWTAVVVEQPAQPPPPEAVAPPPEAVPLPVDAPPPPTSVPPPPPANTAVPLPTSSPVPLPTDTPIPLPTDTPAPTAVTTVTICHKPGDNPNAMQTKVVDLDSLASHLAHGDTLGPCPGD